MPLSTNKVLKGPTLLADLCQKDRRKYTPPQVMALHNQIYQEMSRRIQAEGGPPLSALTAYALKTKAFLNKCQELSQPRPIDRETMAKNGAFGISGIEEGEFVIYILYHTNVLTRERDDSPLGTTVVHETAGSIFSHVSKKAFLQDEALDTADATSANAFGRLQLQMPLVAEGWANYLSCHPFTQKELLYLDEVKPAKFKDLKNRIDLQEHLQNRHFFVALALLKIETAFGWDRVVELMHNMPGVEEVEGRIEVGNVIRAYWELYHEANQKLGQRSVPYAAIKTEGFSIPLAVED
jgi:hypothetical protein